MIRSMTGFGRGQYAEDTNQVRFSQDYYIAIRCDIDVDKYNALVDILRSTP